MLSRVRVIKFLQAIGLTTVLGIVIILVLFLLDLHLTSKGEISQSVYTRSELGTLGDLIGGSLNPILTFLTIVLLIWSIRIQQKELAEATKQSTRSADALTQSNAFHKTNVLEHKKATLIPFVMDKLRTESTNLYSYFKDRPEVTVSALSDIAARSHYGDIDLPISLPSLAYLAFTEKGFSRKKFLSQCKDKNNAAANMQACVDRVSEQMAICTQCIFEVHTACKMLKQIGAPSLLYQDEFNQAEQLNIVLNKLEEDLKELNIKRRSFKLNELSGMEEVQRPSIVIFNLDGDGKPFGFLNSE